MAESIYFESAFQCRTSQVQHVFTAQSGNEWLIEEEWSVGICNMIQKIIIRKRDYFESYYYVDLEIFPASNESEFKICKSARMCSTNIQFIIDGNEYSRFGTFVGAVDNTADDHYAEQLYRYKITATPIFQFMNEEHPKRFGKRSKIGLLKGLKKLSEDIGSLRDDQTSDVVICCGDKQIRAHKNILSVRSTVFCNLLRDSSKDSQLVQNCFEKVWLDICSNEELNIKAKPSSDVFLKITLANIDPSIFDDFIDFIYTGRYKTFSIQKAKDLFVAARKFGIHDLEKKCVLYLKSEIVKKTREDIYNFACTYKCEELQNYVLDNVRNKIFRMKKRGYRRMGEEGPTSGRKMVKEQESADDMDEAEKKKWMVIMETHPTYLENIPRTKDKAYEMLIARFHETDIFDGINEEVDRIDGISNRTIIPLPYFNDAEIWNIDLS